jgi:hypothetical protein
MNMSNDSGYDSEICILRKQLQSIRKDRITAERNVSVLQNRLSILHSEEDRAKKVMVKDIEAKLRTRSIKKEIIKSKVDKIHVILYNVG